MRIGLQQGQGFGVLGFQLGVTFQKTERTAHVIVGEDELANGQVVLRDLANGEQDTLDVEDVVKALTLRLSR